MKLLNYQPHQKITYSAGLISLVLLPILCLCWLYQHKAFEKKSFMNIVFLDDESRTRLFPNGAFPIKKDYVLIDLTGNDQDDKTSLQYAHLMLKRWKITKDDLHGLNFHFGKKAKYWTFVEALNIFKSIDLQIYIPYKNNLYAFWNFHPVKATTVEPVFICGGVIMNETPLQAPTFLEKTASLLKVNWMIFLAFTGILAMSLRVWNLKYYRSTSS